MYRNGKVVDRRWYEKNKNVMFAKNNKTGVFYIRAFVRDIETQHTLGYNSIKIPVNLKVYNLDKWDRKIIETNLEDLKLIENFEDGIYQFSNGSEKFDLLFDGFNKLADSNGILVCFSAAISKRADKEAPFFSGLGVAKELSTPLIAIADPSIALSKELALSWYAGNYRCPTIPGFLANILDIVSNKTNKKITMFGGSGGGFAAMSVSEEMNSKPNVAVWNPQTSISEYLKVSVENYLKICFPKVALSDSIYNSLDEAGIKHDLPKSFGKSVSRFNTIYLQNLGDKMHVDRHARPLMAALRAKRVTDNGYAADNGICFWLKDWGDGHIAPSKENIHIALSGLLENKTAIEIVDTLK